MINNNELSEALHKVKKVADIDMEQAAALMLATSIIINYLSVFRMVASFQALISQVIKDLSVFMVFYIVAIILFARIKTILNIENFEQDETTF